MLEVPTSFEYGEYVGIRGEELRNTLLRDSVRSRRWRGDSSDRLHGGARRTYIPGSRFLLDRLLFSGGSDEFKRIMHLCMEASANLMSQIVRDDRLWTPNRVVTNKMPPNGTLSEHSDPDHFQDGVVVIGAGEAELHYRRRDDTTGVVKDPFENLVYIPPGVPHWVENGNEERVSVVVINDAQLAAGRSAIGQKVRNTVFPQRP